MERIQAVTSARSAGLSTPRASSTWMRPESTSSTIKNQWLWGMFTGMSQRRASRAPSGKRHVDRVCVQ
eukprot:2373959-Rhodomonas_salina.1